MCSGQGESGVTKSEIEEFISTHTQIIVTIVKVEEQKILLDLEEPEKLLHLKYLSEAGILTIMFNFYLRERCSSAAPPSVKVKLNAQSVDNLQTFLEGKAKLF